MAGEGLDELLDVIALHAGGGEPVTVTSTTRCLFWSWCEATGSCKADRARALQTEFLREIGRAIHRVLERYGRGVPEKRVCHGGLCGHADLVVGDDLVVEVKTTFLRSASEYLSKHPESLCQLAFYMHALGARKGLLVAVNRIDLSIKVVAVLEHDKHSELITECVRTILRRAEQLREAIESGKPPAPEPGVWCNLCPYWRECRVALGRSEPFAFVKKYFGLARFIQAGGRV